MQIETFAILNYYYRHDKPTEFAHVVNLTYFNNVKQYKIYSTVG